MDHNLKSRTGRNETDFADQPAEHAARDGGIQSRDPVALALNDGESMTADIVGRIQGSCFALYVNYQCSTQIEIVPYININSNLLPTLVQ